MNNKNGFSDVQVILSGENVLTFNDDKSIFGLYPALEQSKEAVLVQKVVWKLPKWGNPYENCGNIVSLIACPNGHREKVPKHKFVRCFRPECPICSPAWSNRAASRIAERLIEGVKVYRSAGKKMYRARHFIFSPPQEWALKLMSSVAGYKELKECAVNIIRGRHYVRKNKKTGVPGRYEFSGLYGGNIIFHSHRKEFVKGVPVWCLSPHFHVVGYGFYKEKSDDLYKRSGWVYKNKGVRKTLFGTISYELSHCGLGYNVAGKRVFHSPVWFGAFGNSRIVVKSVVRKYVSEKCCVCSAKLHQFDVSYCKKKDFSDFENLQDLGLYLRVEIRRTYMLRNYSNRRWVVRKRILGSRYASGFL